MHSKGLEDKLVTQIIGLCKTVFKNIKCYEQKKRVYNYNPKVKSARKKSKNDALAKDRKETQAQPHDLYF